MTPCGRQVLAAEAEINSTTELSLAIHFLRLYLRASTPASLNQLSTSNVHIFHILSPTSDFSRYKDLLNMNFANKMCQQNTMNLKLLYIFI